MNKHPKLLSTYHLLFLCALAATAPLAQQPYKQPAAKDYIKILEDPHRIERLKVPEVIQTLGLKAGDVVADIGSGSGLFTRPMAQAVQPGGQVYAVDVDPELLDYVTRTAAEQHLANIKTVLGENDSPRLSNGSVDLVFICDTLHHIANRQTYLANVKNCLKPGGRVVIIDFSTGWPNGHDSMRFGLDDLEKWTSAVGYAKITEFNTIPGNFFHVYKLK